MNLQSVLNGKLIEKSWVLIVALVIDYYTAVKSYQTTTL